MNFKARLIELGRAKFTGEVEFSSFNGLMKKVGEHLMTRDPDIAFEKEGKNFVIEAGFHTVGRGELIDCVFDENTPFGIRREVVSGGKTK